MTDRTGLKTAIWDRMLALDAEELATAEAHYAAFLKDTQLDETESHDTSDLTEAREG